MIATQQTKEWLNEECEYSLLFRYECSHCMQIDDSDIIPDHDYEIVSNFPSQFGGNCNLEERHRIRKGDRVSKIRRADNPMIVLPGVACSLCSMDLPRAKS